MAAGQRAPFSDDELLVELQPGAGYGDALRLSRRMRIEIIGLAPSSNRYRMRLRTNGSGDLGRVEGLLAKEQVVAGVTRNLMLLSP